jgi:hypothetical protein
VEGGEHAKAAAAVADDEADGAAPSEASLAGRILGGDVEVLVEVALDAPAPARLHAAAWPRRARPRGRASPLPRRLFDQHSFFVRLGHWLKEFIRSGENYGEAPLHLLVIPLATSQVLEGVFVLVFFFVIFID